MSPSITYWNRLEPRPRASSIAETLAAKVHDPLWMLTRQWQFGEFLGEDTASPAYVELQTCLAPIKRWQPREELIQRLPEPTQPIEYLTEAEPFTPDLALRVEIGQILELLLNQIVGEIASAVIEAFRQVYPVLHWTEEKLITLLFQVEIESDDLQRELNQGLFVPADLIAKFTEHQISLSDQARVWVKSDGNQWRIADTDGYNSQYFAIHKDLDIFLIYQAAFPDQESFCFLQVCAERAIDGVAVLKDVQDSTSVVISKIATPDWDPQLTSAIDSTLTELQSWVHEVFGNISIQDAAAWNPKRLEYELKVSAPIDGEDAATLIAHPGADGSLAWYAFDYHSGPSTRSIQPQTTSILPMHVHFRGMPNARWWDFETGTTDFGNIQPEKRDLGKLVVMDFMLINGNDWFYVPLLQPLGELCWIDALLVHDVFDGITRVKRAEQVDERHGQIQLSDRWTMFSMSREDRPGEIKDFSFLPPTASDAILSGSCLEEISFQRDEMANMVWAQETMSENAIGQPWSGHERNLASQPFSAANLAQVDTAKPPLRYLIQSVMPEHWIPFVPVLIYPGEQTGASEFVLERALMQDAIAQSIMPLSRALKPSLPVQLGQPYHIREEEVPREGLCVRRVASRARWTDGKTYLWISRSKAIGSGESTSGLHFDQAIPNL